MSRPHSPAWGMVIGQPALRAPRKPSSTHRRQPLSRRLTAGGATCPEGCGVVWCCVVVSWPVRQAVTVELQDGRGGRWPSGQEHGGRWSGGQKYGGRWPSGQKYAPSTGRRWPDGQEHAPTTTVSTGQVKTSMCRPTQKRSWKS